MLGKPKTRKEIANEYGITRKTLYNWMKEKKIMIKGSLITPKEQELIYQTFGIPQLISKKEREYYIKLFAHT